MRYCCLLLLFISNVFFSAIWYFFGGQLLLPQYYANAGDINDKDLTYKRDMEIDSY